MQNTQRQSPPSRQVITFYSYKGGTGRSMALANVAWILASNGKTVLTIDWDLEAPGMHRYFAPFLDDPKMADTEGLIDQLYRYISATSRPPKTSTSTSDWVGEYADVQRYAEPLNWRFRDNGRIDLLGPGRQDRRYGERVNLFDWQAFYGKFGGAAFFDAMLHRARADYDYILIDSRTGVSDTSGICTVHLPDALAVFYTLNDQSIEGASAIASDALEKRRAMDGDLTFRVFPVATRIELAEKKKLLTRRRLARTAFEPVVDFLVDSGELNQFFANMEVLYDPYYAYEEILATVADQPGSRNSVLASFEALTAQLTDGAVDSLAEVSETKRAEAQTSYETLAAPPAQEPTAKPERYDVFISRGNNHGDLTGEFITGLSSFSKVFSGASSLPPGAELDKAIPEAIAQSRLFIALIGGFIPTDQQREIETALESGRRVIPVWLTPDSGTAVIRQVPALSTRNAIIMNSDWDVDEATDLIRGQLGLSKRSTGGAKSSTPPAKYAAKDASSGRARFYQVAQIAFGLLVTLALGAAVLDMWSSDPTDRSAYLAVQSAQTRDADPVLSLLLAREAVMENASDFAVTALRESLRASPEIRRYVGPGQAFVTASMHDSSDYVFAADVAGDTYAFSTTDNRTDPVFLGRTRAQAWGPTDRAGRPTIFTVQLDGTVTRWSPLDGNVTLFVIDASDQAQFAFGPNGAKLLQADGRRGLTMWDLPEGENALQPRLARNLPAQPWSADGARYVIEEDKYYGVYSRDGELEYTVTTDAKTPGANDIRLNSTGKSALIIGGSDTGVYGDEKRLLLRDTLLTLQRSTTAAVPSNVQQVAPQRIPGNGNRPRSATAAAWTGLPGSASETNELVAIGFDDGSLAMWFPDETNPVAISLFGGVTPSRSETDISLVTFDRRSLNFCAASGNEFWIKSLLVSEVDVANNGVFFQEADAIDTQRYRGHSGDIIDLDWGDNGKRMLSASRDGTIRVWDAAMSTLNVNVPAEELLLLAESRLPRTFTAQEAQAYNVKPDPAYASTSLVPGLPPQVTISKTRDPGNASPRK